MGGDGGVIASNRKYMRGAGTADHTADDGQSKSSKNHQTNNNPNAYNPKEAMSTCRLTRERLQPTDKVVACAYGRLYLKEAAIQALLSRSRSRSQRDDKDDDDDDGNDDDDNSIVELQHIRKLSDLHDVRFHRDATTTTTTANITTSSAVTCPITGKVLEGSLPAILLVPGSPNPIVPNVVSAGALQQLGVAALEEAEYGPITSQIRLAPPLHELELIKIKLQQQHEQEALLKQSKKQGKMKKKQQKQKRRQIKRKRCPRENEKVVTKAEKEQRQPKDEGEGEIAKKSKKQVTAVPPPPSYIVASTSTSKSNNIKANRKISVGNAARSRVASALESNHVLSSLFTTYSKKVVSEKDHKDNLFAR